MSREKEDETVPPEVARRLKSEAESYKLERGRRMSVKAAATRLSRRLRGEG